MIVKCAKGEEVSLLHEASVLILNNSILFLHCDIHRVLLLPQWGPSRVCFYFQYAVNCMIKCTPMSNHLSDSGDSLWGRLREK